MRWQCQTQSGQYGKFLVDFEGRARGNTMEGRVKVEEDRYTDSAYRWEEERSLTREATDLEGTWSIVHPDDQRSLELTVEHGDGGTRANLSDGDQRVEIQDFYDFGGGFYFTYLYSDWGRDTKLTGNPGWLIGKAHVAGDTLTGEVRFYRASHRFNGDKGVKKEKLQTETWSTERVRR